VTSCLCITIGGAGTDRPEGRIISRSSDHLGLALLLHDEIAECGAKEQSKDAADDAADDGARVVRIA